MIVKKVTKRWARQRGIGGLPRTALNLIIAACWVIIHFTHCLAAPLILEEQTIKASYLYNFAKFVEWPAAAFSDAQAPLVIAVVGKDSLGDALDALQEKTVGGRKIVVKRAPTPKDLERCHILFISASEKESLPEILKAARQWSALTVGDMAGFAQEGGIINLITVDQKINFEINLHSAGESSLTISSKLLNLGKVLK